VADFTPGDERRLLLVDDLSRTQIVQYAGASGDFNPIHTDEVFATQVSNYPSVIAHGLLTMGMSARLFTDWFGDGQLVDLGSRFIGQVRPGDSLTAVGTIVDTRETEEGWFVDARLLTTNQDGVDVLSATATARFTR
jgi:acyl dehydratase